MLKVPVDVRPKVATVCSASLLGLLGFAFFFQSNFRTVQVQGESMVPTFQNGDRLLASSAYWLVGTLRRGDVVVVESETPGEFFIKRVYRLEGEDVDWLNVPDDHNLTKGTFSVPPGNVYVLGDNREVSEDSRKFGPVAYEKIVGKIVLRRWL